HHIATGYTSLARAVVTIPYDPAMVDGHLRYDGLHESTQRAWLRAGAAVAHGLSLNTSKAHIMHQVLSDMQPELPAVPVGTDWKQALLIVMVTLIVALVGGGIIHGLTRNR